MQLISLISEFKTNIGGGLVEREFELVSNYNSKVRVVIQGNYLNI